MTNTQDKPCERKIFKIILGTQELWAGCSSPRSKGKAGEASGTSGSTSAGSHTCVCAPASKQNPPEAPLGLHLPLLVALLSERRSHWCYESKDVQDEFMNKKPSKGGCGVEAWLQGMTVFSGRKRCLRR